MSALFRRLRIAKVNDLDDGTVVNHRNLDELATEMKFFDGIDCIDID
jgi:hypothetical protein